MVLRVTSRATLLVLSMLFYGCGGGGGDNGPAKPTVPTNAVPIANSAAFSTLEDQVLTGQLQGSDADGDALTYRVSTPPSMGAVDVDSESGSFTFIPNPDAFGSDQLGFVTNDGTTDSSSATVTIEIRPVNDAPVTQSQSLSVSEDAVLYGQIQATDVDDTVLAFRVVQDTAIGQVTVDADTGEFEYQSLPNMNGTDTFTVVASDSESDSNEATIQLSVTAVNDLPVLSTTDFIINHDSDSYSFTLDASDPDMDVLSLALNSDPTHGDATISALGSQFSLTYEPHLGYYNDTFTISVSDSIENLIVPINIGVEDANQNQIPDFWDPALGTASALDGVINTPTILASNTNYYVASSLQMAAGTSLVAEPGAQLLLADGAELVVAGELILDGAMDNPVRIRAASVNPLGWAQIRLTSSFVGTTLDGSNGYVSGSRFSLVEISGFAEKSPQNAIELCTTNPVDLLLNNIFIHSSIGTRGGVYIGRKSNISCAGYGSVIIRDSVIRIDDRDFTSGFPTRLTNSGHHTAPSITVSNSIIHGYNIYSMVFGEERVTLLNNYIDLEPAAEWASPALTVALWNSGSNPFFPIENNWIKGGIGITGSYNIVKEIPPMQNNMIVQGSAEYVAEISVSGWPFENITLMPNYWTYDGLFDDAVLDGTEDVTRPILDISNALQTAPSVGPSTMDWDSDGVTDDIDGHPLISTIQ